MEICTHLRRNLEPPQVLAPLARMHPQAIRVLDDIQILKSHSQQDGVQITNMEATRGRASQVPHNNRGVDPMTLHLLDPRPHNGVNLGFQVHNLSTQERGEDGLVAALLRMSGPDRKGLVITRTI